MTARIYRDPISLLLDLVNPVLDGVEVSEPH